MKYERQTYKTHRLTLRVRTRGEKNRFSKSHYQSIEISTHHAVSSMQVRVDLEVARTDSDTNRSDLLLCLARDVLPCGKSRRSEFACLYSSATWTSNASTRDSLAAPHRPQPPRPRTGVLDHHAPYPYAIRAIANNHCTSILMCRLGGSATSILHIVRLNEEVVAAMHVQVG